jgi:hypothetical protein
MRHSVAAIHEKLPQGFRDSPAQYDKPSIRVILAKARHASNGGALPAGNGSRNVGPYLLLDGLAWWQREKAVMRIALLAVIAVLALAGLSLFGVDTWHYFADPRYRQIQRMNVFLVPLAQWLVTFFVAIFALVLSIAGRQSKSAEAAKGP